MSYQIIYATDPEISPNDPEAGKTRVTLSSMSYIPGTNELFVFHNGSALIVDVDYTEEDSTHIILNFLLDDIGPDIDVLAFHVIQQGSSIYIPGPTTFNQLDPPRRPNNFGGKFIFDAGE